MALKPKEEGRDLEALLKGDPRFSFEGALLWWGMLSGLVNVAALEDVDRTMRMLALIDKMINSADPVKEFPEQMDIVINALLHTANVTSRGQTPAN